jgi:hypothetical protein
LSLSIDTSPDACEDSSDGENCRGAAGSLQVSYYGGDNDDDVVETVTELLNDNAEEVSSLVDEFESVEFRMVSSKQASILRPNGSSLPSWLIPFFAAGCALVIYGAFVLVYDKKRKEVVYDQVENDDMNEGLFDPDDKLRSDSNVDFPISSQNWNDIRLPFEDESVEKYLEESEDINRDRLSKRSFVMPSINHHRDDDGPFPLGLSTVHEIDEFNSGPPADDNDIAVEAKIVRYT